MSTKDFKLDQPVPDIFPTEWKNSTTKADFMGFRNLDHFKHVVSQLTQKNDEHCGMTYAEALDKLMRGESDFPHEDQMSIRNLVRSNLQKRGLITQEVYESYRYTSDGTAVGFDVGKYANGEADCVMSPTQQYIDFFYELYISISYHHGITNESIRENTAKLLATIEELERQHIYIKIVLILPIRDATKDGDKYFSAIPLFSHKDPKSVNSMSAIVNDRLLRKFYFAVLEDLYGENIASGYGYPVSLDKCLNIGNTFNEVEFFQEVVEKVGV